MDLQSAINIIFNNSAIAALSGAIVGGIFTRKATLTAHKLNINKSQLNELTETKNSLSLIKVELKASWDIYCFEYEQGLMATPDSAPYLDRWAIGEKTFTIYESIPECLTKISTEVAEHVVQAYIRAKGLIAMIHENNRHSEIARNFATEQQNSALKTLNDNQILLTKEHAEEHMKSFKIFENLHAIQIGMGAHANAMKLLSIEITEKIKSLFDELDSEIQKIDLKISEIAK